MERIELPKDSKVLSVINQRENICLYALTTDSEDIESYEFYFFGTGWDLHEDILEDLSFLGTVSITHGTLIWHVFYKKVV
jgi:hypothetical protein